MILQTALLLGVILPAAVADVTDNFESCTHFFYQGAEPSGLREPSDDCICQRYNDTLRYATLFRTRDRIPVYSAYTIPDPMSPDCTGGQPARRTTWFIERTLWKNSAGQRNPVPGQANMDVNTASPAYKRVQAINQDYA